MASMDSISDSKMEKIAAKAAKRAFQKAKIEDDLDLPDEDYTQEDVRNLISSPLPELHDGLDAVGFDVFDHCDALQKKEGHQISYVIKRNGEMLTVKYHPYSWERLQKEFGAGQYQIIAKSLTSKRYLKQETRVVADDFGNIERGTPQPQIVMPPPQPQGIDFKEMFMLMQTQQEKQRAEARELAREQASMQQNQMMAMVEMMKTGSNQSSQMFLEVAKMTQAVSEKLASSQATAMEKMESRFEKFMTQVVQMTQNNKPDKETISPLEVMEMTRKAEEAGFNRMAQLMALARAEADERMSYREESSGGGGGEKKSLTDTLIESMLPTITTALTGAAAAPQRIPSQPQPRGQLQPQAARPRLSQQKTQGVKTAQAPQRAIATGNTNKTSNKSPALNSFGLPIADFTTEVVEKKAEVPKLPSVETVEGWISPAITDALLNQTPVAEAAPRVLEAVKNQGLSKNDFCKIMSVDAMQNLVNKYGLPDMAFDYFKELHAHISTNT